VLDVPSSQAQYGRWWVGISEDGQTGCANGAVALNHEVVVQSQQRSPGEIVDEFTAGTLVCRFWTLESADVGGFSF
jgi:hypothetical protein